MMEPLLSIKNLITEFHSSDNTVRAVDNVSFDIYKGEIVGLVGESGCGKTVTARSIMGLIEFPGKIVGGPILFNGRDLLKLSRKDLDYIRGNGISMIFQDPTTSLNPAKTVGWQIEFIIKNNERKRARNNKQKRIKKDGFESNSPENLLKQVEIRSPAGVLKNYPHQLSGGMTQRVLIAMALGSRPELVIADEPTTNLDVTIEAQILKLFLKLKEEINNSTLYITHDLGVVSELCDRVIVMYAATIVEIMEATAIAETAYHPYTKGLISSYPSMKKEFLGFRQIPGEVPDLTSIPEGCPFAPRCDMKMDVCWKSRPLLRKFDENHFAACHAI